jgi:nucleoside-diphosphate-sugar epimerase
MKKVLLTGGTGFIGRHCLKPLLERGYDVHAVHLKALKKTYLDVSWHKVDLLNPDQVSSLIDLVRPDQLLHLAWYTAPGKYWNSEKNFSWVNASMTLLQEFARRVGKRVVMAGSCAEYDWRYGYCSEHVTPIAPSSIYGTCKNALHSMSQAFCKEFDLSLAWGRIFFLYGPHENPSRLVPSVIRSLLKSEEAKCSDGEQFRDFLHVQDAANALVSLLDSNVSGPINIASGLPISIKDVVLNIAIQLNQYELVKLGALSLSKNEPSLLVGDVSRMTKEVGWGPEFNLDHGLKQTIDYWNKIHQANEG